MEKSILIKPLWGWLGGSSQAAWNWLEWTVELLTATNWSQCLLVPPQTFFGVMLTFCAISNTGITLRVPAFCLFASYTCMTSKKVVRFETSWFTSPFNKLTLQTSKLRSANPSNLWFMRTAEWHLTWHAISPLPVLMALIATRLRV